MVFTLLILFVIHHIQRLLLRTETTRRKECRLHWAGGYALLGDKFVIHDFSDSYLLLDLSSTSKRKILKEYKCTIEGQTGTMHVFCNDTGVITDI
jgi:hypothetical protein